MARQIFQLEMPRRRLRPAQRYVIHDAVLIRQIGRREQRWPLAALRRVVVGVRTSPYAPPVRFMRLTFARLGLNGPPQTIACGPDAAGYAIFARALGEIGSNHAPKARFETQGGRLRTVLLAAAVLLGAGALAAVAEALMAAPAPPSLGLVAWVLVLLALIGALIPSIRRGGPRPLDPWSLPDDLIEP